MFVSLLVLTATFGQIKPASFVATTADDPATGPWQSLAKNWAVTIGDGKPVANLVSLRRADTPLPAWPRTAGVLLTNGDRIAGELSGGDDTSITLKTTWNGKGLRIPLPAVQVLWLTPIPAEASDFPDRYLWLEAGRKSDVVLLRNGDAVAGDIEKFLAGGSLQIRRKTDGLSAVLEANAVAAVALNPGLGAIRKVKGPFGRVVLTDGSRISFATATADATTLRGSTFFGTAVELPVDRIVSLDIQQGKAANLADLKPKSEAIEPFNDLAWPWQANRTVKARPLRLATKLGTSTFDTGLGTHPRTTLTYALYGKYRRFTALVGLDSETGQRGTAKVRILVDGQEQPLESLAKLTAVGGPIPVSVDLAKAKELTLVVDFGPGGDVQADVNWADARLIE
ncbi:NPCBM/NEW2 domain-containing protein [Limnoglobus roseus]|uniref:NPCBM containing protein n=1 Tax=Limnoglobus roseus TaxID=2598579 RepID=A0A5C1ADB4_9BACT|nr:NPCBM/NEW2 domain-containing protein [Limnoglobus roseus]QEL17349.1 NPCBM containing protein [Limnoglobus roseus]